MQAVDIRRCRRQRVGVCRCTRQRVGIWRYSRYQEVQKAKSGCLEVHKAGSGCLEVQEEGCLHRTVKNIYIVMILFLVPFLVPVFLLSQVPCHQHHNCSGFHYSEVLL